MYSRIYAALFGIALTLLLTPDALAGSKTFGPFIVDDADPTVIALNGDIDINSGLSFRRALQAAPAAKLVTLDSLGGSVQMGLLIADDINQRKLATYIPKDNKCFSACSFIFLAGEERRVDGALGVHQISSDSPDLVGTQLAISDIIEVLNRFGTPMEVMQIMFKTPPNDIHVFTHEEVAQYHLNRATAAAVLPADATSSSSTPAVAKPDAYHPDADRAENQQTAVSASENRDADQLSKLSPLEEFTRKPDRIVVYTGLDLFGDDISSTRVSDAAECATRCLMLNGQCKAFTFNSNTKIKRGPNCFLKASAGRPDGNSAAFSGRFLSAAEPDPSPLMLATIDPLTALVDDIDLPGADLSRRPNAAKSPSECRLACIDEKRCVAFTYVKPKKECWLKSGIGTPVVGKGMVSGLKKFESFSPAKIISLK